MFDTGLVGADTLTPGGAAFRSLAHRPAAVAEYSAVYRTWKTAKIIDISDGFTRITAGADAIAAPPWPDACDSRTLRRRVPTGARVTLEFSSAAALSPDQPVRARYEFGGDGRLREAVGIAKPTRVEVRWGRAVIYHYRMSHWIAPGAFMSPAASDGAATYDPIAL